MVFILYYTPIDRRIERVILCMNILCMKRVCEYIGCGAGGWRRRRTKELERTHERKVSVHLLHTKHITLMKTVL